MFSASPSKDFLISGVRTCCGLMLSTAGALGAVGSLVTCPELGLAGLLLTLSVTAGLPAGLCLTAPGWYRPDGEL